MELNFNCSIWIGNFFYKVNKYSILSLDTNNSKLFWCHKESFNFLEQKSLKIDEWVLEMQQITFFFWNVNCETKRFVFPELKRTELMIWILNESFFETSLPFHWRCDATRQSQKHAAINYFQWYVFRILFEISKVVYGRIAHYRIQYMDWLTIAERKMGFLLLLIVYLESSFFIMHQRENFVC